MFFISDDKTDNNIDVYKILEEESSKHLTVKQKPTQIKNKKTFSISDTTKLGC